jgi:peptidoglycan/LPS O-acetylase OafA/YrhL
MKESRRILGLDTMRFVAALWVLISHLNLPFPPHIGGPAALDKLYRGFCGNIVSGPAAVIVFFVISGFCIHYPLRGVERFPLPAYFARRYLRIGIPLIVAALLARPLNVNLALFGDSILWSLFAELTYYTLYPLFRWVKPALSWRKMIVISFVLAFLVAASKPRAGDYPSFGVALNWLLGLPCWLLGCELAESFESVSNVSQIRIWQWRFGIWALSMVCSVIRFQTPVGFPWILNLFAIAVAAWLAREIAYWRDRKPALFERAGQWSYSIYLVHVLAAAVFSRYFHLDWPRALAWCVELSFALTACYFFYLVVEKQSHRFARRVAEWFSRGPATMPAVVESK